MAQKRIYTHDEVVNTLVGEKGSAKRDAYDLTIELFLVGRRYGRFGKSAI